MEWQCRIIHLIVVISQGHRVSSLTNNLLKKILEEAQLEDLLQVKDLPVKVPLQDKVVNNQEWWEDLEGLEDQADPIEDHPLVECPLVWILSKDHLAPEICLEVTILWVERNEAFDFITTETKYQY